MEIPKFVFVDPELLKETTQIVEVGRAGGFRRVRKINFNLRWGKYWNDNEKLIQLVRDIQEFDVPPDRQRDWRATDD